MIDLSPIPLMSYIRIWDDENIDIWIHWQAHSCNSCSMDSRLQLDAEFQDVCKQETASGVDAKAVSGGNLSSIMRTARKLWTIQDSLYIGKLFRNKTGDHQDVRNNFWPSFATSQTSTVASDLRYRYADSYQGSFGFRYLSKLSMFRAFNLLQGWHNCATGGHFAVLGWIG